MSLSCTKRLLAVLPLFALGITGCSSLDLPEGPKWPGAEEKPQIPSRIVDVWTDDVLHQGGQPSKRGFGGRLMFYDRKSESPVKVEGTLTAYLFDDECEDPLHATPLHKYIFPAETLQRHYSKSELGHSYSFWLPVDEVGGVERKLTIVTRFDPKVGGKVMTKPCTHVLPGRPVDEQPNSLVQRFEARQYRKKADGEVQQVAYVEPIYGNPASAPVKEEGITTATINVPPAFARQMMNGSAQSALGVPLATPAASPMPTMPANPASPNPGPAGYSVPQAASTEQVSAAALPPVHSELSRFPARREALGRPVASRVRTQPLRATWPSALPTTPRSAPSPESTATSTNAPPSPSPWSEQEVW